ncbi:MAG: sensor histidine kinase [Prolixibacteraceae bacterium]
MKATRKYFVRRFLSASLLITLFTSGVLLITVNVWKQQQLLTISLNQKQKVFSEKRNLESSLDEAVFDLLTISTSQFFNSHLLAPGENDFSENNFKNLIESILTYKQNYTQIRFIDTLGMENFRVNQINGHIIFAKKEDLQDKSQRNYFQEGIKLNRKEVYISEFDLNVEKGKIEKPFRPMIRICSPVFDNTGKKVGIDVINFDGNLLLQRFRNASLNFNGESLLINNHGYLLSAKDTSILWGFMFENKKDVNLKKIFPEDFFQINQTREGQFHNKNGLFTISSVNPIATLEDKAFYNYFPKDYSWKIISFIPENKLSLSYLIPFEMIIFLYIIILIAGLVMSYYFASISERKFEVQKELVESEKNLRLSNQTKDRFFSILSHDLKNASGGIYYFLEFLNEDYDSFTDEVRKSHLKDVTFAASQQNKLLYEILDWARLQQGKVEYNPGTILVKELFENQIALVELALKKKGLRIELDLDPETTVYGDNDMLKTIFRNLINNAIKFSYHDDRIVLSARSKAEKVEMKVTDFGIGMRDTDAEKIFDVASKVQQSGTDNESGTGFGLKLVAELVKKNNGTIHLESELKKGSTFILSFPSGK